MLTKGQETSVHTLPAVYYPLLPAFVAPGVLAVLLFSRLLKKLASMPSLVGVALPASIYNIATAVSYQRITQE